MPIDKYLVIKRAAEIDEIVCRLNTITDINAAFSGNEKHIKQLTDRFNQLIGSKTDGVIGRPKDSDWVKRLQKYAR